MSSCEDRRPQLGLISQLARPSTGTTLSYINKNIHHYLSTYSHRHRKIRGKMVGCIVRIHYSAAAKLIAFPSVSVVMYICICAYRQLPASRELQEDIVYKGGAHLHFWHRYTSPPLSDPALSLPIVTPHPTFPPMRTKSVHPGREREKRKPLTPSAVT